MNRPNYIPVTVWNSLNEPMRVALVAASAPTFEHEHVAHGHGLGAGHNNGGRDPGHHGLNSLDPYLDPALRLGPRQPTVMANNRRIASQPSTLHPNSRYPPRSRSPNPGAHLNQRSTTRNMVLPEQIQQPPAASRMDERLDAILANQERMLIQQEQLAERVTAVEKENHRPGIEGRGQAANRGRAMNVKKAYRRRNTGAYQPPLNSVPGNPEDMDEEGREELEDLGNDVKTLSMSGKVGRNAIQKFIVSKFRELTGVKGRDWPLSQEARFDPDTKEQFLTPDFEADLTSHTNRHLIQKVAHQVYEYLEPWDNRPHALQSLDLTWNQSTIEKFTKTTFRSFKRQYQSQVNEERAAAEAKSQRANRWAQRRKEKCKRLRAGITVYIDRHGVDPTPFLCDDHMSDEASGPDSDSEEDINAWQQCMAGALDIHSEDLSTFKFLEVIRPEWRSEQLSDILHKLNAIQWELRNAKERKKLLAHRVANTARTSGIPPLTAPWDFGINFDWLDAHGVEHATLVEDWGRYGNPPGFSDSTQEDSNQHGKDVHHFDDEENLEDE